MKLQFRLDFKKTMFYEDRVGQYMTKKKIRAFNRLGGFIRTTARRSIRRRSYKVTSPPGSPPFAHIKHPTATLKNIQYAYVPASDSMVAGPLLLHGGNKRSYGKPVPAVHEFGGDRVNIMWRWIDGKKTKRLRPGSYPPRPFMRPALGKALTAEKLRWAWGVVNG